MGKQTQVTIDAMYRLYGDGYVRTTDLNGDYSNKTVTRVLRQLEDDGLLVREKYGQSHTYYPTDKLTQIRTGKEIAEEQGFDTPSMDEFTAENQTADELNESNRHSE